MKFLVAFALVVAVAMAAPPTTNDRGAQVLRQKVENIGGEGFKYDSETSNGISASAQGQLRNVGTAEEAQEVRGEYSYPGPDGVVYTVTYIANENGFQPNAAHLPVPPQ